MPRDLESEKATLEGMPSLSREDAADAASPSSPNDYNPLPLYARPSIPIDDRFKKLVDLHPYSLLLSAEDLDDCDWLEHEAFDAIEAASREKLEYRLQLCGELCSGLFTSGYATSPGKVGETVRSRPFPSIDSHDSDRKKILLAHVICTKSSSPLVTDAAMSIPDNWRTTYALNPPVGHAEDGETLCLHSLAVHPRFQGRGLGRVLLLGWCQRMRDAGIGKRVAIICRDRLIPFYEKLGFDKAGPSACQYGGGGWWDMVLEFDDWNKQELDMEY
ncbi:acetyltransferase [Lojkania enalia]|uniref:Acetyltransferase n=1 Tax=Lojkania enalia TaxID=147567 RepID=A0A9P4N0P3_9PLEO|nr:acetyltransferase [Didymosphaeria enalia]